MLFSSYFKVIAIIIASEIFFCCKKNLPDLPGTTGIQIWGPSPGAGGNSPAGAPGGPGEPGGAPSGPGSPGDRLPLGNK